MESRSLKKEIQKGLDGKAHQRGSPHPKEQSKSGLEDLGEAHTLT